MNKLFYLLSIPLAAIALYACDKSEMEGPCDSDFDAVIIKAHNFQPECGTKTTLDFDALSGAQFTWSANDIVGIFPDVTDGTQVRFPITTLTNENTQVARFDGKGWAVRGANTYAAYFPFVPDMNLNKTAIPVDFTGQVQNGSGSAANLSSVDYMAASSVAPQNFEISFDFKHLGALLVFDLNVPKVGEYTSFTMTCDTREFTTKGTINILAATPSITTTETSHDFVITLQNFVTTTVNQKVRIYAMIPPVDLSGQVIKLRLRGPHADFETSYTRGAEKPYRAGVAYIPEFSALSGGEVIKLEPGESFNKDIKSLVNNDTYLLEKYDYKIKSVKFETNNSEVPVTSETIKYCDVSDEGSPSPIYAIWNSSTGALTIRTSAGKVYANEQAQHMFYRLEELANIDLTGLDVSYSQNIRGIFQDCATITSLDLSGFDTANVSDFNGLFYGCVKLTTINNLSSLNVMNAGQMQEMFKDCSSLTSLDLRSFKTTTQLSLINDMFMGCSSLTSITFGNDFVTSNVSNYSYLFYGCGKLTKLDLSMFDTSKKTDMFRMFCGCSSLEEIKGNIVVSKGTIVADLFNGCAKLKSIDVSKWDVSECGGLSGTFLGCSSLSSLDVSNWNVTNNTGFDNTFNGCSNLTSLDVSKWNTSSATNMTHMFSGCSHLQTIDVSHFVTVNNTDYSYMFADCSALTSLNLSSFVTKNATTMLCMFAGCSSLTSLDVSTFDISHVITLTGLFSGCKSLKTVNYGVFDTHYCEDFNHMYSGSGFEQIDLSFFKTDSARNIRAMFLGCKNLKNVNLSSFDLSHLSEGVGEFFQDCPSLENINLGKNFRVKGPSYFATGMSTSATRVTITCSPDCMNDWLTAGCNSIAMKGSDSIVTWINAFTGETMTPPSD
jgi:surface protein